MFFVATSMVAARVDARVLLTVDEALALAFVDADTTRETVYLTEDEVARASTLAGSEVPSALVSRYRGASDGATATAYLDVHLVRTLQETILIVIDENDTVARVEVLSFDEPPDYQPRQIWYDQLRGRALDRELAVKRAIPPVAGATLTVRATVDATRRVLAIHQVIGARVERPAAPRSPPGATSADEHQQEPDR